MKIKPRSTGCGVFKEPPAQYGSVVGRNQVVVKLREII